jgi:hypothetical protein
LRVETRLEVGWRGREDNASPSSTIVDILRDFPEAIDEELARVEDLVGAWAGSDSGASSSAFLPYVPERLRNDRSPFTERREEGYRSAIARPVSKSEARYPRRTKTRSERELVQNRSIGISERFGLSNSDQQPGANLGDPTLPPSNAHSFALRRLDVVSAMDPDRKSHVSSFYGGRRPGDASNNDYPANPGQSQRSRYDSASSYNNQDTGQPRPSTELLNGGGKSAGYNQNSFFDAGRTEPLKGGYDEEDPLRGKDDGKWDIFADFNNAGPKYSEAFVDPEPK